MPSTAKPTRLAYLKISMPVSGIYVGGVMVTDERGLPIEFQYTEPIQPNSIQQILYGQVLSRYIKQDVILGTLLKNLKEPYDCLLVDDEQLMEGEPTEAVVRISQAQGSRLPEVGQIEQQSPTDYLLQVTAESNPLRVQLHGVPQTNLLPANAGDGVVTLPEPIKQALLTAGQSMDLTEPLVRIEKALASICQEAGIKTGK